MKVKDKDNVAMYICLGIMYILGAIADGIGHINWLINLSGIVFECAAMCFIIESMDLLYEHRLVNMKRLAVINIGSVMVGIIAISILWNCKMFFFFISMGAFIVTNIFVLIASLCDFSGQRRKCMEIERQKRMYNEQNEEDEEQSDRISITIKQ